MKKIIFLTLLLAGCAKAPIYQEKHLNIPWHPINVGVTANDGTGDNLRAAFTQVNTTLAAQSDTNANKYTKERTRDLVNDSLNAVRAAATPIGDIVYLKTDYPDMGIYNVLDYGAIPDDAVDDTKAFQDAIDAAQNRTVFVPAGNYLIDSLRLRYATTILGVGWSDRYGGNGSVLTSTKELPVFRITTTPTYGWSDGATIRNIHIIGNDHADDGAKRQTGIYITTEAQVLIDRVWIEGCGDYAIRLGTLYHTTVVTIQNCRLFDNVKGGIYGRLDDTYQINATRIINNEIDQNHGYGINLIGTNTVIRDNTIQGNAYAGIYMSARDMGDNNCTSLNTIIDGNYLEANGGGAIYAETYYDDAPEVYQYHYGLEISNNYMLTSLAQLTVPGITALITFAEAAGSVTGTNTFRSVRVRDNNYYSTTGGAICIAANGMLNYRNTIEIPDQKTDVGANYTGIAGAKIVHYSYFSGALTDGAPTAVEIGGILDLTPAEAGDGYETVIHDSDGTGLNYIIRSDGSNWMYWTSTKAL